jgi:hypothetical protein
MHFESVINSDILDHLPIPTAILCDLPSINVTTPALLSKSDPSGPQFPWSSVVTMLENFPELQKLFRL